MRDAKVPDEKYRSRADITDVISALADCPDDG